MSFRKVNCACDKGEQEVEHILLNFQVSERLNFCCLTAITCHRPTQNPNQSHMAQILTPDQLAIQTRSNHYHILVLGMIWLGL